jgi:hypothetical protein
MAALLTRLGAAARHDRAAPATTYRAEVRRSFAPSGPDSDTPSGPLVDPLTSCELEVRT